MILLSVLLATLVAPRSAAVRPVAPIDTLVVSGTITDRGRNVPINGASVTTTQGFAAAVSGADGRYRLQLIGERVRTITMTVRMIGFAPTALPVKLRAGTVTIDVALVASQLRLESVVVTGGPSSRYERKVQSAGATISDGSATAASGRGAIAQAATPSSPVAQVRMAPALAAPLPSANRNSRGVVVDSTSRVQYAAVTENPFLSAAHTRLSTFAIDVDRASYSDVRRYLDSGMRPPRDAVRIEELVNYFQYDYRAPARGTAPLDVTVETHAAPWQPTHRLVRIGMQAQRLPIADLPPANLVFLIDVSGSMQYPDKLPLVIQSLRMLTAELRAQDRVAIVVYAGSAGLVLPSTPGTDKATIIQALDRLQAGGSTNGAAGIRLAYQVARENFVPHGANRVIVATDGDFNVGVTSEADLVQLIETERRSGVFLTMLGFGRDNTQHGKMEQLADKGNGQYAFIDDLAEAQKALVREMGGTLFTLAKDVKIQVEFNPSRVRSYRLIGYENRLLRDQDFNDDTKDAGELGAGHSVTALYEVELTDAPRIAPAGRVDPLRYESSVTPTRQYSSTELAFVKVRYQAPRGGESTLLTWPVHESAGEPTTDYRFAAAVAGFGLALRDSEHKGAVSFSMIRSLAESGLGADREGDRARFLQLVGTAERLMGVTASTAPGKDDR